MQAPCSFRPPNERCRIRPELATNTAAPGSPGRVDAARHVIMPEIGAFGGHNIATKPRLGTTLLEHRDG
jgi:hypothetical protein